jgi:lysophospholipase L1-like esterase
VTLAHRKVQHTRRLWASAALAFVCVLVAPPLSMSAVQGAGPPLALEDEAPTGSPADVLSRLVVIGASVSNGFGLRVSLADALHASIAVPHEAPLDGTLGDFFRSSDDTRATIIDTAIAREPTAVIAVDFLYWYVHGSSRRDEQQARLDLGLAELARFECPVVVSLLPDLSTAPAFLFAADLMPRGPALAAHNRRIAAWAVTRANVILLPLPVTLEDIRHGRALRIGSWSWEAGSSMRFLLPDGTHPTETGLVMIACMVNEALRLRVPGLTAAAFVPDAGEILETLRAIRRVRELTAQRR